MVSIAPDDIVAVSDPAGVPDAAAPPEAGGLLLPPLALPPLEPHAASTTATAVASAAHPALRAVILCMAITFSDPLASG
jgi:hypothetical protein